MSPVAVVSRVLAAIFGSYAFVWGVVALGVAALNGVGVDYHSAEQAMMMLAFVLYLALFLWTFAAASLWRVWLVLALGSVLMLAAAWQLQRMIIG
ncbi:MAG: iron uptake protein [Pseudomonas balearica]|nr:iron uptake protein [Stutzerimonas balearica]